LQKKKQKNFDFFGGGWSGPSFQKAWLRFFISILFWNLLVLRAVFATGYSKLTLA
jgi:hypothetical protein